MNEDVKKAIVANLLNSIRWELEHHNDSTIIENLIASIYLILDWDWYDDINLYNFNKDKLLDLYHKVIFSI